MNFYSKHLHVLQRLHYFTSKHNRIPYAHVTAISSLLIYTNLYSLYGILMQLNVIPDFINSKAIVVVILSIVAIVNYYVFIRHESFDDFSIYKVNNRDIFLSIVYAVTTITLFISVANHNRERISNIRTADKTITK